MDHKPYSPEWHRKRCLREAMHDYLISGDDNQDIIDILTAHLEYKSE